MKKKKKEFSCPHCLASFGITEGLEEQAPQFCPYCGTPLDTRKTALTEMTLPSYGFASSTTGPVTLVQGHEPEKESVQFTLGPYQILKAIGKGGMGEVFLAYDTTCGRRIALKRIRSDLMEHIQMHNRFLKEARITSQLTHPSIIPIYAIQGENQQVYYTMPFVEGETLKEILHKTRRQEKRGEPLDHIGGSILALMRIYLNICQAISYAHAKNVLHRDIKPENIIVGQFGEVLILDWGLAKLLKGDATVELLEAEVPVPPHPLHQLTHIGKVVGTVNYMAPERAVGNPATIQSDIYSLGVILFQILTLRNPYRRGTLKEFKEKMHVEVIPDPQEVAPYREVPKVLAQIAIKCLSKSVEARYQTVNELIRDIENYIEGRAEWFHIATLDIHNKANWEFQENVLLAEHVAITREMEVSDWVSLMISKYSFSSNIKIEAKVQLGNKGAGFGFLLAIPEATDRHELNDGYLLWIGSDQNRSTKLLASSVEVLTNPDLFLERNVWYHISLEKLDNNIYFYVNGILQLSYISYLPFVGTHMGVMSRDDDFNLKDLHIYVGSQSVMVNCLAVPDAFLAHKDYTTALSEYRRIGYSFPGRTEGREAMFRAGITLLEQAKSGKEESEKEAFFDEALTEFEKLHSTPGAPLEYLGKASVYETLHDFDEEVKCFELAYRRYPRHPLLPILQEQIINRMHATSRLHRIAAYKFMLLAVRHIPKVTLETNTKKLFTSLKKHWEPLPFILKEEKGELSPTLTNFSFAIPLAFFLAKTYVLEEIIEDLLTFKRVSILLLCNALFSLLELGSYSTARNSLETIKSKRQGLIKEHEASFHAVEVALALHEKSWNEAFKMLEKTPFSTDRERVILLFMQQAIDENASKKVYQLLNKFDRNEFSEVGQNLLDSFVITALLLEKRWQEAGDLLHTYPLEILNQEGSPLHFLYGCWLYITEGKEIASVHFAGLLDIPFPRTGSLFSHFFDKEGKIFENWQKSAFLWEKRQYFRQMAIFYDSIQELTKAAHYRELTRLSHKQ